MMNIWILISYMNLYPGRHLHTTMVTTLSKLSQYSILSRLAIRFISYKVSDTYLSIGSHIDNIQCYYNKKEDESNRPARKVVRPVLEQELEGDKIRCCRYCIVEPVVPC